MMDAITAPVLRGCYRLALAGAVLANSLSLSWAAEPLPATVEFNRDIRPILADKCFHCHGPDRAKRKAELRLDTKEGALAEDIIVPGNPARSELFQRLTAKEETERMPPVRSGRQLTARQIGLMRRWIEQGAKWQKHWSLIPPKRPIPPAVKRTTWPHNPIDAFILRRLERQGLEPSSPAAKTTLIRRVTLDLTGLPPTPGEVDAFLADASPVAYDKAVDRLLHSPRYGERMVLEWLDAARYADSNGYQQDGTRTMWPWRDWVITALNRNMPFDQFTIEQLAGDLLPRGTRSQKVATGFNRNHMLNGEGGRIPEESRIDYVVDRVDTTATVWMGLTLGCCRCHDHKYDPFNQKEYYQIFAYFNNVAESGSVDRGGNAAPVLDLPTRAQTEQIAALKKTLADLDQQLKAMTARLVAAQPEWEHRARTQLARLPANIAAVLKLPAADRSQKQKQQLAGYYQGRFPERQALQKKLDENRSALTKVQKSIKAVMVMEERPQPRATFVLQRGQYDKPGAKVGPGVPASLPPLPRAVANNRLGFARWLVDPGHPLTARVAVNRSWQMFFGTGLVKTTEDFGTQGAAPSHPELLDWLATEFMRTGWDVKALHRLIVTSATYRQSSRITPLLQERDPVNMLLARGPRLRLSSFAIRDQALALSGLLAERVGGPPVKPYQPPGIWEEMSFGQIRYQRDQGPNLYRRSLYTFWRRSVGPTTMFDTSARQVCTVRQSRTNTPLQSLILLNDETYVEAARVLAQRLMTREGSTLEQRITQAFRLATARPPSDAERRILTQAFGRLQKQYQADKKAALKLVSMGAAPRNLKLDVVDLAAYTGLASVVLNLDEVISKE